MTETEELTRLRELAKGFAQELNRRVAVEQLMLDAARGKRAMPTPEELRAWAMRLGVPEQTPEMVTSTFVGSPLEIQSRVTMNPKLERAMVLKSIPMLEIAEFVADDEAMIGLVQCAIEDKRVPFAYDCCWPPDGDGRPYTELRYADDIPDTWDDPPTTMEPLFK